VADGVLALANASDPTAIPALVNVQGQPVGWIDTDALRQVPSQIAGRTPLTAVLVPFAPGSAVPIGLSGLPLLSHIDATSGGARLVPVVDEEGRLAGALNIGQLAAELANLRSKR